MKNEYLRHTIATIAYRFQKVVMNADDDFGNSTAGSGSRTPSEIVNHMTHVLSFARMYVLEQRFEKMTPDQLSFDSEIERFNEELKKIDQVLSNKELGIDFSKKLLQGPFSDILTHIGQIAMLSRLNGNPIKGEDFSAADIKPGV